MKYLFFIFCSFLAFLGNSQVDSNIEQSDTIPNQVDTLSIIEIDPMADEKNALFSAILPGLGQVRNKQYVKAGGLLATFGFGLYNTIQESKDFRDLDDQYNDYLLNYQENMGTLEDLNELWDSRQKQRNTKDIWTAATTYIYVGNLIDAAAQYKIIREEQGEHSATKAAYYSAILPGLGQAYNKKYWKIPLVYAALGGSLYAARNNRNYHRDYLREIEYRAIGESTGFRTRLEESQLEDNLEYWRKWRDAGYIIAGVVYVLNIVDATVDAHLIDFNVDDELNFDASPTFGQINGQPYYAVQFNFPILQK